ncbi:histidine kinase [Streptomyces sp. DSM 44915]|uniref:histidine kinase n=1 Tax=Streptomyces chisholmiae TaxID=3075540 RepID=A0ABU2JZU2_9ACTN|nr:histidine kinase [Streptomyces sp. DSM 44915]MDT0270521.1 histidine kinase [Streptomyces sp. DSM 44915]
MNVTRETTTGADAAGGKPWTVRGVAVEGSLTAVTTLVAIAGLGQHGALAMIGGGLAAVALTLLRRRHPASVLAAAGAATALYGGFWLVLLVAGWSAGWRVRAPGRAVAAFTTSGVLFTALTMVSDPSTALRPQSALYGVLVFLTTTALPGIISRYRGQRQTLLHALHEHNARLLRERELIGSHARLRERQRIAQDMHDSLGHRLALITVHTGALEVDPSLTDAQRERVAVLRSASATALQELRDAVGLLHEDDAPDAGHRGDDRTVPRGVAGIDELVAASRDAGATVALRRDGTPRPLAPAGEQAAYRITQEALTNALKHAPGAPVTVELRFEPDALVVEIANGPASPEALAAAGPVVSGGQGLTGLAERARLVGGMVHTGHTQEGGFRVAGMLPYGSPPTAGAGAGTGEVAGDAGPVGRSVAAPFVDAAGDFRGQRPTAPEREGGTVIDWAGSPARQEEIGRAMGRRKKKGIAIGCGAALFIVVSVGALFAWAYWELESASIKPSVYEAVEIGDDEESVRDRLPGTSFLIEDYQNEGPEKPAGAECLVLMSTEQPDDFSRSAVYRFCFEDGALVEKLSYEVDL